VSKELLAWHSALEHVASQGVEYAAAAVPDWRRLRNRRRRRTQNFAQARTGRAALLHLLGHGADFCFHAIGVRVESGGACRSPAALIILPRFSASLRKGKNPLMHSSDGPPCNGGAGGRSNAEPGRGAAPAEGNALGAPMTAAVTTPLTGGKAGLLAGNDAPGSGASSRRSYAAFRAARSAGCDVGLASTNGVD
jgi:hypothetical protein